ncbi:phosphotransferase family protein [Peribacillus butanolivorans]|uniref:phosphotransferase family protein n=1 Tax=Peribacillus butanolivorans TaxID=421767 RepID=UPI0036735C27
MSKNQSKTQASQIDWNVIENYIRSHIPFLPNDSLQAKAFSAGYSNITYQINIGKWEGVFRRQPFGDLPPNAHDMKREFTILGKLNPVFPLAPKPFLYCDDPAITDKQFYIMEKKVGLVLDDSLPPELDGNQAYARAVSETVVDTLTCLHSIDYQAAGLNMIGKPNGYLERQVKGWIKRYERSKTDELDGVGETEQWLLGKLPSSSLSSIVHNDFKLNNMMFSYNSPEAVAVFDWEMSTIGDPLTDLAISLAYWTEPGETETGLTSVTSKPGFLTRREFANLYALKSGNSLSDIDYYLTFAFYKIAVVLQQLYYRWKNGDSQDSRFEHLHIGIKNLMHQANRAKNRELL